MHSFGVSSFSWIYHKFSSCRIYQIIKSIQNNSLAQLVSPSLWEMGIVLNQIQRRNQKRSLLWKGQCRIKWKLLGKCRKVLFMKKGFSGEGLTVPQLSKLHSSTLHNIHKITRHPWHLTRWVWSTHPLVLLFTYFIPINSHDTAEKLNVTCVLKYCTFMMFSIVLKITLSYRQWWQCSITSGSFDAEILPTELWHVEADSACYI